MSSSEWRFRRVHDATAAKFVDGQLGLSRPQNPGFVQAVGAALHEELGEFVAYLPMELPEEDGVRLHESLDQFAGVRARPPSKPWNALAERLEHVAPPQALSAWGDYLWLYDQSVSTTDLSPLREEHFTPSSAISGPARAWQRYFAVDLEPGRRRELMSWVLGNSANEWIFLSPITAQNLLEQLELLVLSACDVNQELPRPDAIAMNAFDDESVLVWTRRFSWAWSAFTTR